MSKVGRQRRQMDTDLSFQSLSTAQNKVLCIYLNDNCWKIWVEFWQVFSHWKIYWQCEDLLMELPETTQELSYKQLTRNKFHRDDHYKDRMYTVQNNSVEGNWMQSNNWYIYFTWKIMLRFWQNRSCGVLDYYFMS